MANGKYKRGPDQIAHQVEEKTRKRARRNLQKLVEKGLRTEEEADIIAHNYVPYKETHKQAETVAVNHFNGIRTRLNMKAIEQMRCNSEEYFPYCRMSQPSRALVQRYERYLCEGVNTSCPLLENGEEDIAQFNLEIVIREIIQCAKLEGYRPTRTTKSKVLLSDIMHIPVLYLAITTDGAVLDTHKGMVVQMVKVVTPMLVQRLQQEGLIYTAPNNDENNTNMLYQSPRRTLITGFAIGEETKSSSRRYETCINYCC